MHFEFREKISKWIIIVINVYSKQHRHLKNTSFGFLIKI